MTMTDFSPTCLRTGRLLLRPLRPADAPQLFTIFSDPQVMRYWSTPPWSDLTPARAMIERDLKAMAAGEYVRFGIERLADGVLLGQCTLFNWQATCRRAEIGYGQAASAWGQGFMHEALQALLDFGFGTMNLNRVEADIDPRNGASARSLLRLGFRAEGLLRERWIVGGEVSDSALYGLLRSERHAAPSAARPGSAPPG
jgi:RimJ/RimL family protein N-acetyltransferase